MSEDDELEALAEGDVPDGAMTLQCGRVIHGGEVVGRLVDETEGK